MVIIILFFTCLYTTINASLQLKPIENIFLSSIPKSGTHLCTRLLGELVNKEAILYTDKLDPLPQASYYSAHQPYSYDLEQQLRANNFRGILIIRDPRDQIISFIFFIYKYPNLWPDLTILPFDQLFEYLVTDGSIATKSAIKGLDAYYRTFLLWKKVPDLFYVTRFEDLVGTQGGGSLKRQRQEIATIAQHLQVPKTPEETLYIGQAIFGRTWTFREGQIGSWKKYFTQYHKDIFKEHAGKLLIDMGYETDYNW
ncbi:MAG TPA: sulfotransferase domain-containing protein [Candidatus Babeliaceae bacterium]|nr:sulfotransferase domain-containing protein [Candidatus Babeliaceae bacterium]